MYDYHTHSNFSDDSNTPMEEMVKAAISKNIKEIAVTDHYDPDYPDNSMPFGLDMLPYQKEMERLSDLYRDKIKVIKGIEIGIQHGPTIKKCLDATLSYSYDFVIGSFHSAHGATLDQSDYHKDRDSKKASLDYYEYVYNCINEFDNYDVLGHINVIDRYVDEIQPSKVYTDHVEEILKHLVQNGKGLEINTSSFRYKLGDRTTPPLEFLKLYIELGGEIITTGSDAHSTDYVGYKLDFAENMIKKAGHKYVATFHNRKLIQHKLDL